MAQEEKTLIISRPNFQTIGLTLNGAAPYMQNRFPLRAKFEMMNKMKEGSTSKSKKKRDSRNFENEFLQAQYVSTDGWNGIPAAAFRNACIDACRATDYFMSTAKTAIFIESDGFDKYEGTPLVKIISEHPPEVTEMPVKIARGTTDIRIRPMWRKWSVYLRVRFDADMLSAQDILNLVMRAGLQIGVGEGRPYSKGNGIGFGLFNVESEISPL